MYEIVMFTGSILFQHVMLYNTLYHDIHEKETSCFFTHNYFLSLYQKLMEKIKVHLQDICEMTSTVTVIRTKNTIDEKPL